MWSASLHKGHFWVCSCNVEIMEVDLSVLLHVYNILCVSSFEGNAWVLPILKMPFIETFKWTKMRFLFENT